MLDEPLDNISARQLIRTILDHGTYKFTKHAREEMAKDRMVEIDAVNVLRGGFVESSDFENDTWRYRVKTPKFVVVVAFRSEEALVVVTAWRLK